MTQSSDYTGLITSEHSDKPKYTAMVAAVTGAFADATNVAQSLPDFFDLDAAVGVQLDVIGLWVGISRKVKTPLANVYFSLDVDGLGLDQGSWQGPFDPTSGLASLDDDTYRTLIRAKIGANSWDGTIGSSDAILQSIFPGGQTQIFIQDNQDMTAIIGISGTLPPAVFLALLTGGYVPLKPEGVNLSYLATSVSGDPVFGFDVENQFISGFDTGAFGVPA